MLLVLGSSLDHSDIWYIESRSIVEHPTVAGILKFRLEFHKFFKMLLVLGSSLDHSDICFIETRLIVEHSSIAGILKFRLEFSTAISIILKFHLEFQEFQNSGNSLKCY